MDGSDQVTAWRRAAALVVDFVVVSVGAGILCNVAFELVRVRWYWQLLLGLLLNTVFYLAYRPLCLGKLGHTVGEAAFGIKRVDGRTVVTDKAPPEYAAVVVALLPLGGLVAVFAVSFGTGLLLAILMSNR